MIAFATLFLGLVAGPAPVSVIVGAPVAAVAVELDGRTVATMSGPPWSVAVDLGEEYRPHELVAVAYDREGEELGRARQWLNLPRAPAEVEILLERDPTGLPIGARLTWGSLMAGEPEKLSVTFDGVPLALDAARRAKLPPYEPTLTHILSAELEFPYNLKARSDVVLGGGSAGRAQTELTAIPVRVEKGKPPPMASLRGALLRRGEPIEIAAVEKGRAQVVVVRDLGLEEARKHLGRLRRQPYGFAPAPGLDLRIAKDDRMAILWPIARRVRQGNVLAELFERSRDFSGRDASLHWLLTRVYYPGGGDPPRRFSDAVAVAGLDAFAGYGRRAVVLVLGEGPPDRSAHPPEIVRRYLETIRVPFHVWSLSGETAGTSPWGAVEDISFEAGFRRAVGLLKKDLDSQWIVWLAGRHLPDEITLAPGVSSMTLVR